MEEICQALYLTLKGDGSGAYKVFYEDELMECCPADMQNRETLEAALKWLTAGGYADVKYARGEIFCVKVLKEFTPVICADERISDAAAPQKFNTAALYILTSVFAFLGGLTGGVIVMAAAAL